jgi:hypothetical protein
MPPELASGSRATASSQPSPASLVSASSSATAGLESLANGFVHKQLLTPGNGRIPPDKAIVTSQHRPSTAQAAADSSLQH